MENALVFFDSLKLTRSLRSLGRFLILLNSSIKVIQLVNKSNRSNLYILALSCTIF